MANRRKDSKDACFGNLDYDIAMYAQYLQNASRKRTHGKRKGNVEGEVNMTNEEEGGSRNTLTTRGQPSIIQEDIYSLIKMEKHLKIIVTVFDYKALTSGPAQCHKLLPYKHYLITRS